MNMVLFDMLGPVTERLRGLRDEVDGPRFAEQLLACRPDAFSELPGGTESSEAKRAAEAIAAMSLARLRQLPEIVDYLCKQMVDRSISPALRSTIAFALAYLVTPTDLFRDDLPGGFGYIDDAIMLWGVVGATHQYHGHDSKHFETATEAIKTLSMSLPREKARLLENTGADAMKVVYLLAFVPEPLLVELTRRYIRYPAEMIITALEEMAEKQRRSRNLEVPSRPDFFTLPDGGVGISDNGTIAYQFDGGDFVALC
jgi:uncharacterized membrane protein YkvA (DUF1232 family)